MNVSKTRILVFSALFVALAALLGGAFSIKATLFGGYNLKLSFGALPVMLAGIWFGPLWGGAVGMLADAVQALMFPMGPYMPWFSISNALFGVIPGLFFLRDQNPVRLLKTLFCVALTVSVTSVGLNTFLIVTIYGSPWEIVYARMLTQAVMIPLHTLLIIAIERSTRFVRLRLR